MKSDLLRAKIEIEWGGHTLSFIDKALERAKESRQKEEVAVRQKSRPNPGSAKAIAGHGKFGFGRNPARNLLYGNQKSAGGFRLP